MQKDLLHTNKSVLTLFVIFFFLSCQNDQSDIDRTDRANLQPVTIETDLVIGAEDQPMEYQFGQPVAVRSDTDGNIYVADRSGRTIKVFNEVGEYIESIGGRGRGPGEFQEMDFMEFNPDGHLVIMDRGNLQYTTISTDGEFIESFPYSWENQFYPSSISYVDGQILALFFPSDRDEDIPRDQYDLFYTYSTDFQEPDTSFFPFINLGIEEGFPWMQLMYSPGSFALSADKDEFIYSPGIYTGDLYLFSKDQNGGWSLSQTIEGVEPLDDPYYIFSSEAEFENTNLPGANRFHFSGGPFKGRVFSLQSGIFYMNDGRIAHFFGEVREHDDPERKSEEYHLLDLYVQIFNSDGEAEKFGELYTLELHRHTSLREAIIQWKDEDDSFYFMGLIDGVPEVRKFELQI